MGEVAAAARALAGRLDARGVRRGDVVLTLLGNRPEWVLTMLACFRMGYVVLPCTEQLRAGDLRLRLASRSRRWWSATSATSACCARPAGTRPCSSARAGADRRRAGAAAVELGPTTPA